MASGYCGGNKIKFSKDGNYIYGNNIDCSVCLSYVDENSRINWNKDSTTDLKSINTKIFGLILGLSQDDNFLFLTDCSGKNLYIYDIRDKTNWLHNYNYVAYQDYYSINDLIFCKNSRFLFVSLSNANQFFIFDLIDKSKWKEI